MKIECSGKAYELQPLGRQAVVADEVLGNGSWHIGQVLSFQSQEMIRFGHVVKVIAICAKGQAQRGKK